MPQYNRMQYGLKQYGLFLPIDDTTPGFNFEFIEARMGAKVAGEMIWVYQHRPIEVLGETSAFRLRTSTGETLYEKSIQVRKNSPQMRMRSNVDDWVYSHQKVEEEQV